MQRTLGVESMNRGPIPGPVTKIKINSQSCGTVFILNTIMYIGVIFQACKSTGEASKLETISSNIQYN